MEVIMSSPVQECSRMENAENPDSKHAPPHFNIISQSSVQNNPNNSLVTTESAAQKHAVSTPAAGDANTGSKREEHMETSSSKMITGKVATPDAKTVSKGEKDTKVANVEMDSVTTVTDNTVSKKRKIKKGSSRTETDDSKMVSKGEKDTKVAHVEMDSVTTATDNTVSKKRKKKKGSSRTETDDSKMVSKGEKDTKVANVEMDSVTTVTDNTVSKKRKIKKGSSRTETDDSKMVSKGEKDTKVAHVELDSVTTATDNTVSKKRKIKKGSSRTETDDSKMVSKGEKDTKVAHVEMDSVTTATDNTVSKKRKIKKGSSRTETDDSKMVSKGEKDTKVAHVEMDSVTIATDNTVSKKRKIKKGSSRTETDDSKMVSKGENDTKIADGEMGSDTTVTNNTVAKKRKRQEKKNKSQASNDVLSVHESTQDMVTVKKGASRTETDDSKMVSNGEKDTKVAIDEMGLVTTATSNTVSKQKKSQKKKNKNQASNDILSVHEGTQDMVTVKEGSSKSETDDSKIVSKGEKVTKVANDEMGSGTTATNNTVSKKKKGQKEKNKNQASNDILSVHEGTQDMVTVKEGSSKTETDDSKIVSKGEKDTKIATGEMGSGTTTNLDKNGTVKKEKIHRSTDRRPTLGEILNPQYLELMGPAYAKIMTRLQNKKRLEVSNKTIGAKSVNFKSKNQTGNNKVTRTITTKPRSDDISNPRYLEELELAEANRASSKEISKKIEIQPIDLNTHENTKVKPSNDITRAHIPGKKLLIFDVNGLLADIVSPRPKDAIADLYIPKRAVFKRPFLDDFLRFCFERFNVGIWSSRTKKVLDPVVDYLLGDLKKNLLFYWDASHCTNTGMKTIEDRHKPMVFKDLRKIWRKNGPGNSRVEGTYHESNTLLVDDSPYKALLNPKNTAIFPLSYRYKNTNDDFLGPNGALRTYLEGLADSDDVKTYVEQHPFGQLAIDEKHRHWSFYKKSLKGRK